MVGALNKLNNPSTAARPAAPNAVLDAAQSVFADRGYRSVTPEEIAERAGLPVAELGKGPATLESLLIAVLNRRDDADGQATRLLDNPGGLELLHRIAAMVRTGMADVNAAKMHTVITAEATASDHPAQPWAMQRYRMMRALFAAAFRRDIEVGRIRRDVDADALAIQLIAVMDGVQLQWLLDPDEVTMADALDDVINGIIRAIREPGD